MKKFCLLAAAILAVCTFTAAHASLPPGTTIEDFLPTIEGGVLSGPGNSFEHIPSFAECHKNGSGYKWNGQKVYDTGLGIITVKDLEFDPDPSVFANQIFFNNTANTQSYVVVVVQPAFLNTVNNEIYGSVVVSLQDSSQPINGSLLQDNNTSIYKAFIDGGQVKTMLDPAYSLSTNPPATTVDSGLQEFGWENYNGAVLTDISIRIELTLSPGDTASVLSRFDVQTFIPEPATLLMLGLGSVGILKRRK